MANIPDNRFIASTSLEEYFVDKNSGLPLSNGAVYFYQDISRTTPKLVYELTGDPTNVGGYTFVPLDSPVRLSATGTFVDDDGNNIAVYYFPYDGLPASSANTLDLYYVVVVDSSGAMQFTRSAWPSIAEDLSAADSGSVYENQLSNSQFVDISFGPANSAFYTYGGAGNFVYQIAPDWELAIVSTGAGTINVVRIAIPGGPPIASNPPYTLTVIPGTNLTTLAVRQVLKNNPGIWSQINGAGDGYISGSILLYPNSQVTMTYVPSTGLQKTILIKNNTGAAPVLYNATVQLPVSNNPSAAPVGFVSIYLYLPTVGAGTRFSSVQVVGLTKNQAVVPYVQEPVNRQIDHLFHYYNSQLQFKPIKSYLVGWDFPLNPVQFQTSGTLNGGAITGSINRTNYAWDQTLIYAATASGVTYGVTPNTNGLRVTANAGGTQFALVQYLDQVTARALFANDLSVNVSASTNIPAGITATVSLWYTTAANLPNAKTLGVNPNQSLIQTLGASGNVTSNFGAGWVEVRRTLVGSIAATFTVSQATAGNKYFNVPLTGWAANNTAATTATYFAIVVGFANLPATNFVDFNSISLVPGRIATIPAPQTLNDVLKDCQQYYWTTYFDSNSQIGTATPRGAKSFVGIQGYIPNGQQNATAACSFQIEYPSAMRINPSITLYSSQTGLPNMIAAYENEITNGAPSTFIRDTASNLWSTSAARGYISQYGVFYDVIGPIPLFTAYVFNGTVKELFLSCHVVADARLGIV